MKNFYLITLFALFIFSCAKDEPAEEKKMEPETTTPPVVETPDDTTDNNNDPTVAGFLYTSTNGEGINQILKLECLSDGSLVNEVAYATETIGGANTAAGGDAFGDFDSQGAIQIIGDYLLNVNAGGNSISVFSIDRPTGDLTLIGNTDSNGERPVSISFTLKAGSTDQYWVAVGNQWNNPNVQKDGEAIERYPNDEFHALDLTAQDASDENRNLALFSFDATSGALSFEKKLATYVRENGGPTCVVFSDDGTKISVSTWGIAHFGTQNTSLEEQHSSRIYVYDFSNGEVSGERYFEEEGIAGSIGQNWAKDNNSVLHVSNFNLIPTKRDNSLTVLMDNGTEVTKVANYNTVEADDIDEACWTILNPDGDKLYVSSFGANAISIFDIGSDGLVTSTSPVVLKRSDFAPAGDTKDMFITSDNSFMYVIGAFQSFSINRFDLSSSGGEYVSQTTYETTKVSAGTPGVYNFLGLIGYDL